MILTTSIGWVETVKVGRGTKRIPINVSIFIRATESNGATRITGVARGTADTSDFDCGIVRRIAESKATSQFATGLPEALKRIQRGGTELYAAGASDVLTIVRDAIRIGRGR